MGRTSDARKRIIEAGHELIWSTSFGSVTVDAICERAHVQKGTFYHFFDSKADLTIAVIDQWWDGKKQFVDECFSPSVPPLQRIIRYIDGGTQILLNSYDETGRFLGCPMFTLASEICTVDAKINARIREILDLGPYHFGNAIRDAQALGELPPGDADMKARIVWTLYEGSLIRARIENDPDLVRNLSVDALSAIGAQPTFLPLNSVLIDHVAA